MFSVFAYTLFADQQCFVFYISFTWKLNSSVYFCKTTENLARAHKMFTMLINSQQQFDESKKKDRKNNTYTESAQCFFYAFSIELSEATLTEWATRCLTCTNSLLLLFSRCLICLFRKKVSCFYLVRCCCVFSNNFMIHEYIDDDERLQHCHPIWTKQFRFFAIVDVFQVMFFRIFFSSFIQLI